MGDLHNFRSEFYKFEEILAMGHINRHVKRYRL